LFLVAQLLNMHTESAVPIGAQKEEVKAE